jgi:hypothetical protein
LHRDCGLLDPQADCLFVTNAFDVGESLALACTDSGMHYDAAAGATCLQAVQAANSALVADCTDPLLTTQAHACSHVFTPAVAESGACGVASQDCVQRPDGGLVECVSSSANTCDGVCVGAVGLGGRCDTAPQTTCGEGYCGPSGTCVLPVDGQACPGFFGCDAIGDYCRGDGGPAVCVPRRAAGQDCASINGDNCVHGARCSAATDGGPGRFCEALVLLGGACTASPEDNCADGFCIHGVCTAVTGAPGGPCFASYPICTSGYCGKVDDGGFGTCVASPALGDACDAQRPCAGDLGCSAGTCQPLATAGQPCTSGAGEGCRTGSYCDRTHTCQLYGTVGAVCDRSEVARCLEGYCDATSHCAARKPEGAACTPTEFECSVFRQTATPTDGGAPFDVDAYCLVPAGGSEPVCAGTHTCP